MRENYCFENGCNVHWPYWKNTCDQVCCNMSDNNIISYDILKKFLSGINDNPDISFTSCKGLLAPSSYYTYYATRFNTHVKIDGRDERILEDSNYIGQGTKTYELLRDGYPPLSLTDLCAILHDIQYALTTSKEESVDADRQLRENLLYINRVYEEPSDNIDFATELIQFGNYIDVTPGPHYGDAWGNPAHLELYQDILTTLWKGARNVIPNWSFLYKYYDSTQNRYIL